MKTTIISFFLILIAATNIYSQGIPYGVEFQVTKDTTGYQSFPIIKSLQDGGFVVCWEGSKRTNNEGIFGQIFNSSYNKKGNEFQINSTTSDNVSFRSIATINNNKFIVCWSTLSSASWIINIYGQIFNISGEKLGNEFKINEQELKDIAYPSVSTLKEGSFIVCWNSRISEYGICAQKYDSSGNKIENIFEIYNYQENILRNPVIKKLPNVGYVICWTEYSNDGYKSRIIGQLYDENFTKKGNVFQVCLGDTTYVGYPTIASFSDGGFVVCWETYAGLHENNIYGQLFDMHGVKRMNEFRVNSHADSSHSASPSVISLPNDGFLVCWTMIMNNYPKRDIICQFSDNIAQKIRSEFKINSIYDAYSVSAISLSNNDIIFCWEKLKPNDTDIFAKIYPAEPLIHQFNNYLLIEPYNDATISTVNPVFNWQQPSLTNECYPWEITFDLYIDTDYNFSYPHIIKNIEDTTYTIDSLAAGKTYFWKVLAKNLAGDSLWSTQQNWGFFIKPGATLVENVDNKLPKNFELFQNYPNPFNSSTEIKYSLPNAKASYKVQLKIYDVLGRLAKVLVDQEQSAGSFTISWNGTDLGGNRAASGVYSYNLKAG